MAKAREVFWRYPDYRDQNDPGYDIPAKGQVIIINDDEIPIVENSGFVPMYIVARSEKYHDWKTIMAFGLSVEDEQIIPFPNRSMADRIAQMISTRQQQK